MTQDEIIEMWDEVVKYAPSEVRITEFAKLVAAKEREACAKVCEDASTPDVEELQSDGQWGALVCAAAIRARGEQA